MTDAPYPQRKSPRLQGYDYAQAGAYFVTICTHERYSWFGHIREGKMVVNRFGITAQSCWEQIPAHFPTVEVDAYVVMPNHVHGIVILADNPPTTDQSPKTPTLGTIIGSYKSAVTRLMRTGLPADVVLVWQPRYHDHIIRNERDLERIRAYIKDNPAQWEKDTFYERLGEKEG